MRRPRGVTIRSMMVRSCWLLVKEASDLMSFPFFSTKITSRRFTIISVTGGISQKIFKGAKSQGFVENFFNNLCPLFTARFTFSFSRRPQWPSEF